MTILVDADVLLDVALGREPHATASGKLLDIIQSGAADGFIAWHTLSNVYYLLRPKEGSAAVRSFLSELLRFMQVAPTSTESARYAAGLSISDFEDALQAAAAMACRADGIATRNIRHYRQSPVKAETPLNLVRDLL